VGTTIPLLRHTELLICHCGSGAVLAVDNGRSSTHTHNVTHTHTCESRIHVFVIAHCPGHPVPLTHSRMAQSHGRAGKHLTLLMAGLLLLVQLVAASAAAGDNDMGSNSGNNAGDQSGCVKGDYEIGSSSSECHTVYVARPYD
jgi:hypothetical protein